MTHRLKKCNNLKFAYQRYLAHGYMIHHISHYTNNLPSINKMVNVVQQVNIWGLLQKVVSVIQCKTRIFKARTHQIKEVIIESLIILRRDILLTGSSDLNLVVELVPLNIFLALKLAQVHQTWYWQYPEAFVYTF